MTSCARFSTRTRLDANTDVAALSPVPHHILANRRRGGLEFRGPLAPVLDALEVLQVETGDGEQGQKDPVTRRQFAGLASLDELRDVDGAVHDRVLADIPKHGESVREQLRPDIVREDRLRVLAYLSGQLRVRPVLLPVVVRQPRQRIDGRQLCAEGFGQVVLRLEVLERGTVLEAEPPPQVVSVVPAGRCRVAGEDITVGVPNCLSLLAVEGEPCARDEVGVALVSVAVGSPLLAWVVLVGDVLVGARGRVEPLDRLHERGLPRLVSPDEREEVVDRHPP